VKSKAVVEPDKRSAWLRKLDEECQRKFSAPASSRRSSTSSSPGDRPGGSLLRRDDRYWVISTMISGTANERRSAECSREVLAVDFLANIGKALP
jgi:hypothetical protein